MVLCGFYHHRFGFMVRLQISATHNIYFWFSPGTCYRMKRQMINFTNVKSYHPTIHKYSHFENNQRINKILMCAWCWCKPTELKYVWKRRMTVIVLTSYTVLINETIALNHVGIYVSQMTFKQWKTISHVKWKWKFPIAHFHLFIFFWREQ